MRTWISGVTRKIFAYFLGLSAFLGGVTNAWSISFISPHDGADTQKILTIFESISQVPRCSKHEGSIAAWLARWASDRDLPHTVDRNNNVIIRVPGSAGRQNDAPVALQAHTDMVCAKTPNSTHDFGKDPIELVRKGDWLWANNTTLGGDDGIGVAMALFVASDPSVDRPPLELVFTTDEEMDMTGAENLAIDAITARRFINLDWETEGSLALGSAGGNKMEIMAGVQPVALQSDWPVYQLTISGLTGGHSGLAIHKGRANANVLAAQILREIGPVRLISFDGGVADNAIATSAEVVFAIDPEKSSTLIQEIRRLEQSIRRRNPEDPALALDLTAVTELQKTAASVIASDSLISLLLEIPQGVFEWSDQFKGLPETSNNIGMVRTRDGVAVITVFHRSFQPAKLDSLTRQIQMSAANHNASDRRRSAFPAWPPQPDAALYQTALSAYQQVFGQSLQTHVVHAGLECGFIAQKYPDMEIISIGPILLDVHTPTERLHVPSVERISQFLRQILKDL